MAPVMLAGAKIDVIFYFANLFFLFLTKNIGFFVYLPVIQRVSIIMRWIASMA